MILDAARCNFHSPLKAYEKNGPAFSRNAMLAEHETMTNLIVLPKKNKITEHLPNYWSGMSEKEQKIP